MIGSTAPGKTGARQPIPAGERAQGAFDSLQAVGILILLVGLPISEAMKSAGLVLALIGFVGKLCAGRRPRSLGGLPSLALTAYFGAAAVSVVLARPGMREPRELLTLGGILVLYPLIADSLYMPARRGLFLSAALVGAAVAALAGFGELLRSEYPRLTLPSIENAVPAAEFVGMALAMALAFLVLESRSRLLGPLLALGSAILSVALFLTQSRGPWLGSAVGSGVVLAVTLPRRIRPLTLLLALVPIVWWVLASTPDSRVPSDILGERSVSSRRATWAETVRLISERPLAGHGLGTYAMLDVIVVVDDYGEIHQPNAHNAYLHILCETGLLGGGTFLAFLVLALVPVVRWVVRVRGSPRLAMPVAILGASVTVLAAGVCSVSVDQEPGMLFFSVLALAAGATEQGAGRGHRNSIRGGLRC